MSRDIRREIIVDLSDWREDVFKESISQGITSYYCDPRSISKSVRERLRIYSESTDADIQVVNDVSSVKDPIRSALYITISTVEDLEKIVSASKLGIGTVIVKARDWKIIPLENLIASLQRTQTRIIAVVEDPREIETMYGILERGVDGVLIKPKNGEDIKRIVEGFNYVKSVELSIAEVVEVKDVGLGDRACIDTVSILSIGEGMLVGSRACFLFLLHNESIASSFTEPRPFRVNAGAIHSYTLTPNGRTKYLSELRSGDRILIVDSSGSTRSVAIGRVKIERRPLRMVAARIDGEHGTVIVQNAETIRFIGPENKLIPSTDIKPGDKVLVYVTKELARHFGQSVDEFIIER